MTLFRQEQGSPYEQMSKGFRDQTAGNRGLALVGLVLLSAILVAVLFRVFSGRDRGDVRRLFRRLADASALGRDERRLLTAVAERAGEENAASLFFRRSLFEETVADMSPDPQVLDGVRRKVYGP